MSYKIGLNIGLTATGWAVIENAVNDENPKIINTGVRVYDSPEKGDSTVKIRQKMRNYRRKIRRKKFRLQRTKELLLLFNIINKKELSNLYNDCKNDIYQIRYEAGKRLLFKDEWARLLIHFMQRRGYIEIQPSHHGQEEINQTKSVIDDKQKNIKTKSLEKADNYYEKTKSYPGTTATEDGFIGKENKNNKPEDKNYEKELTIINSKLIEKEKINNENKHEIKIQYEELLKEKNENQSLNSFSDNFVKNDEQATKEEDKKETIIQNSIRNIGNQLLTEEIINENNEKPAEHTNQNIENEQKFYQVKENNNKIYTINTPESMNSLPDTTEKTIANTTDKKINNVDLSPIGPLLPADYNIALELENGTADYFNYHAIVYKETVYETTDISKIILKDGHASNARDLNGKNEKENVFISSQNIYQNQDVKQQNDILTECVKGGCAVDNENKSNYYIEENKFIDKQNCEKSGEKINETKNPDFKVNGYSEKPEWEEEKKGGYNKEFVEKTDCIGNISLSKTESNAADKNINADKNQDDNKNDKVKQTFNLAQKSENEPDIYNFHNTEEKYKETGLKNSGQELEIQRIMAEKGYKTIGEMLFLDWRFRKTEGEKLFIKTRNSLDEFMFVAPRALLVEEIKQIFETQRRKGNLSADDRLEKKYLDIFTSQRDFEDGPGAGSPYKGKNRGYCPVYKNETRAPKASYLNEYIRLLSNLNNIIIRENGIERGLDNKEREELVRLAHIYNTIKYSDIAKIINAAHDGVIFFKNERFDKFKAMTTYHRIKKVLNIAGPINESQRGLFEKIAEILTSYKNEMRRYRELCRIEIIEAQAAKLSRLDYYGSAFLSMRALNEILPPLLDGDKFQDAYTSVFGTNAMRKKKKKKLSVNDCSEILNPVIKRAFSQTFKVINALIRTYGNPTQIYINFCKDIKYSYAERKEKESHKKSAAEQNNAAAAYLNKTYKVSPTPSNIIKFRLWKEQQGICFYSGARIPLEDVFKNNACEIDHIIPYSKSFDDSYSNKLLVKKEENINKNNRTAYEFVSRDTERLNRYSHLVNAIVTDKEKRKNLFRIKCGKNDHSVNNESKYVMRIIRDLIKDNLKFERCQRNEQHVEEVNGVFINYLTAALGYKEENYYKNAAAAAAAVICNKKYTKELLRHLENNKNAAEQKSFPEPWTGFIQELKGGLKEIFISRMPRRKATGRAHKDTVRSSRPTGIITKTELNKLKINYKNGEIENYYKPETDILLYNALKKRLKQYDNDAEEAFREPFYKPKSNGMRGPLVKKVKIIEKTTLGVAVRDGKGIAANGNMVRIDIFLRNGKYFFVPVYVSDTVKDELPLRAIVAHKPYSEWETMKEEEFLFSLYQNELIRITHKRELIMKGKDGGETAVKKNTPQLLYYLGANISAGTINTTTHDGNYNISGLGIKTLLKLEKLSVDPLGNYYPEKIPQERQKFNKKDKIKALTDAFNKLNKADILKDKKIKN